MRTLLGLAVLLLPFVVILYLLCVTKRNTGEQHGGGLEQTHRLRNGWFGGGSSRDRDENR